MYHRVYDYQEQLPEIIDLMITNADKGGAVVIMDTDSYIREANLTKPATNN